MGDWRAVNQLCDALDRVEQCDNPDAHYFRSMSHFDDGIVTGRDLLRSIKIRNDETLVATSTIDRSGTSRMWRSRCPVRGSRSSAHP
jgi:hypothetical protein